MSTFLGYKKSISTFPVQERSLQDHDDKQHFQCEPGQTFPSGHRCHHNIRLRKLILPALLILLALCGLLAWSCVNWHGWSTGARGVDSLVGRALNDTTLTWGDWFDQYKSRVISIAMLVVVIFWCVVCCWWYRSHNREMEATDQAFEMDLQPGQKETDSVKNQGPPPPYQSGDK